MPRLLGSYDSNQPRYGGYVNGNNGGYINGHVSSLQVIDATAYIAYAVNPSDDFYAVAADLLILDVANPATPTLLGSYDLKYRRNGIDLREAIAVQTIGTTAYVLDQYGDLQMFDVTNPAVPFSFSLYYRTGRNMDRDEVRGMYISNDVAYVADGFSGLYMVNVSRPSAPSLRGSYSLPSNSNDVCGIQVINNIAYVADGSYGVWILDVSNLSDLIVLSAYTTPDGTYNAPAQALMVQVINNIAYVADYGGLLVLNVTNPAEPTLFGRGALSSALGLQVVDQVAYVVGDGLQIVQLPISITQDYEYILSFAPDNYFEQPLDIRITASDGRGGEATDEFRLTMESCNYDDGVTALIIAISALIGGLAASYFCFSFCFSHITAMMDSRKDHPFADELQKCLRLADVSDFRSPHGRAYLEVVEKLLRAFETRGINIKSMMIAEQKQVAVDVAEAIRSLISSRIGFFGCSKSDITLSAIRQIVGTVADRVRDKRMGHARQEEAQERELGVVLAR